MKRIAAMLAFLVTLGAAGQASAVIQGQCVGRCVQDRGEQADASCIESCSAGGDDVGCSNRADGCCNEYFLDSDPDCGSGGVESIGPGGACDPASPRCLEGLSCLETAPGSGEFICKEP